MSDLEIRPLSVDERRAATDTLRTALLSGAINDADFEESQASWDDSDGLAAWDADRCVGTTSAFHFDSTVPGGTRVPTAGVTRVGVLPTHTRRGLLSRMMQQLLTRARARGDVLATLHASETAIYRRFGFGLGTDAAAVTVTTKNATPLRARAAPGSMRMLSHREVLDVVPPLYERVARWRVGSLGRPVWWWQRVLKEASEPSATFDAKGSFVAVHTSADGTDDGFVSYEVEWADGFAENPRGVGKVHDLWGIDPTVELELWRYLLDIDLIVTWRAEPRPVDEPVRRAMNDSRAYEAVQRFDEQWVRILDVDTALGARSWGGADEVAVAVADPTFADNNGVWSITADGASRVGTSPEIEVDIATLSAAYLGAVSWHDLAATGAVTAAADVLERLDALFVTRPIPFCGTGY